MTVTDAHRSDIVDALRAELVGPAPPNADAVTTFRGKALTTTQKPTFKTWAETNGEFHEAGSGEEILKRDRPTKRYGVGVLYPIQQELDSNADDNAEVDEPAEWPDDIDPPTGTSARELDLRGPAQADDDDFDLSNTTQYQPSAMAVSFLVALEPNDEIVVAASGGRYEPLTVKIQDGDREWWVRRPVTHVVVFNAPTESGKIKPTPTEATHPLDLSVEILARQRTDERWLITVSLINRAPSTARADLRSLFQAQFGVTVLRDGTVISAFEPYPDAKTERQLEDDEEAQSLDLLYRNAPTFAIGHGCAATWPEPWGQLTSREITAEPLPAFETPSITPDIEIDDVKLAVPLGPLAGLDPADDGFASIEAVINAYGVWIDSLEGELPELAGHRRAAAERHIEECRRAHSRMVKGARWLSSDAIARRAFSLANRAVLRQQLQHQDKARETSIGSGGQFIVEPGEVVEAWSSKQAWRAFQIGFIVATARSAAVGDDEDRENVELIFFPTGGGKTEAYQGLAAFSLFYARLQGRETGVGVLMRYTLRLLTSQQFLRAAGLICAMERIRIEEDLDGPEFSIGIWVGLASTPTRRADAKIALKSLNRGDGENPFLLLQCPWCAAQMGPVTEIAKGAPRNAPKVAGYKELGKGVAFFCPDRGCDYQKRLPVYVIDEDVYDKRPSIVIGTVDKFAMLAYREEARRLFGLDDDGDREVDPPNLIIQDELHLIAGPLGSMVGMYEAVIEELCTDRRDGTAVRPKIVASTATIRRYEEQIKGLYARNSATLFPPHGIDASDSFFARFARTEDGKLAHGRMYLGVHAPGLGSMQTAQVRTASALLQAAKDLPVDQQDPWWTSMMFFNSLRELGTSMSLIQSDIPDYLRVVQNRFGIEPKELRRPWDVMELTSRYRQDEIPAAIGKLERTVKDGDAIDVCLASSIIEVGIDIGRLSLLTVVGQPKSTSQYIQITGRVGRRWQTQPGLVVTIYGASKPRDRSHFERFQSYHQRLYAEVEPVSVTPFAAPVLRRALHAAVIAYIRQTYGKGGGPWEIPPEFDEVARIFEERINEVDPAEARRLRQELDRIRTQWTRIQPDRWQASTSGEGGPLLRRADEWVPPAVARQTWPTPQSMRGVDAECQTKITDQYLETDQEAPA